MVLVADDYVWIVKWHKEYQPDPHPQVGDIYSGLKASVGTRAKDVTSPCHYWVKGMPGICINFYGETCGLTPNDGASGYNNGFCDYLGRRSWCSKYVSSGDLPDEYICIAPDMFRTGLGKRDINVTTHLELLPYKYDEILGYNGGDDGIGRCDGLGMGRGLVGIGTTDPEEMYILPVVCKHYKPGSMGFGAIKPRPMGTAILEGRNIYDGSKSDPLSDMSRYLPFIFNMLNLRAYYQKCGYWDQDFGADFEMDYSGGYASIMLPEDPLTECICKDDQSIPYRTIIDDWPEHTSAMLMEVLTEEKGIVCNGAHSECPCYTGKWIYCVPDNMRDGMRITAEQILELRFWVAVWQTKSVYDSIFAEKSGTGDLTTSDLFTFDRWEKLGDSVEDSVMIGKRIYQCFPIPLHERKFDPEVYLTKEAITYPKANSKTGTGSSTTSSFPTLVRDLSAYSNLASPIDVIYPYTCEDPWGVEPCGGPFSLTTMEVASCKLEQPATAIFGHTIKNKDVYALNINETGGMGIFSQFEDTMVSFLPPKQRRAVNARIQSLINWSFSDGLISKYIVSGTSNEYGYFGIGPLPMNYANVTYIAIICKINEPNEYEVVLRKVRAVFYGSVIIQNSFVAKQGDETNYVTLPSYFPPSNPAKLSGDVHDFSQGSTSHSVFPVYSKYTYGKMQDTVEYSYCINEYTIEDFVRKWVRIGPTGYIWAFLDNPKVSYLFDFEVISATISYCGEGVICGTSGAGIDLEVIHPKVGDPDAIKRRHLPPDCVLLKAEEINSFFNEDWHLSVNYKYKMLEPSKATHGGVTVWPVDLDGALSINKFVSPPFNFSQVSRSDTLFKIDDIKTGTIALMAYTLDKSGRIQAAIATKMLCDVVTTRCRPVEISYSYKAEAVGYDLIPNSGFFTWVGGDKVLSGTFTHYRKAKCGDHDCNKDNCIGPMWFPFNDCTSIDFYSWYSGAATCTMPIEGQPRSDWRYRMADEYKAWVREGGNWAAACGNGWYYSYSKAGKSEFSGSGKIRTSVNLKLYSELGWTDPPFGNDGREITERWLSQEYYGFWDLSGVEPVPRSEYMPLVVDDETLFTSFDAFEKQGRIGPIANCFHTTSMLNWLVSELVAEKFILTHTTTYDAPDTARFRFEDLFEVLKHAWCMYPPPVYEGPGDTTVAIRYSFKEANVNEKETLTVPGTGTVYDVLVPTTKNVAWAWKEYWLDIGRGVKTAQEVLYGLEAKPPLDFVSFNKPPYYFDFEKIEHRLITDEGKTDISFKAPALKGDGGTEYTHPEISITGGIPRKFNIIYDDYNDEQVDWVDECGDEPVAGDLEGGGGEFGGAGATGGWGEPEEGGEQDAAVYEKTTGDEWFHDVNTIFDSNASSDKSDDRKIVLSRDSLSGDTFAWYNRGLIANIPKNRLTYLPYAADTSPVVTYFSEQKDAGSQLFSVWYNNNKTKPREIIVSAKSPTCITRVEIKIYVGVKGRTDGYAASGVYCHPEIIISEYGVDDDVLLPFPPTVLYTSPAKTGKNTPELGLYYKYLDNGLLEVKLSRLPKRVLFRSPLVQIKLILLPGEHLMLGAAHMYSGKYIDIEETLDVWEHKYVTSTGEFGDKNPDGVESSSLRSFDRDLKNAGQYFPTGVNSTNTESTKIYDKMTMVGAGEQHCEDIDLELSIGNLKEIEKTVQKELYEDAYNRDNYDTLVYNMIVPPNVQTFFDLNNVSSYGFGHTCTFISEKISWGKHQLANDLQQDAEFWQAGGHYFKWGSYYLQTSCYLIGPLETVYYPVAVHHKHGKDVVPWTPYEAYVGWGKLEFYEGKLDQAIALEKGIDTGYDWTGPAGGFVMETFT